MPKRIQLSRAKGWRMPEGAVKVDRSGKWGNPHRPSIIPNGGRYAPGARERLAESRRLECVEQFRIDLRCGKLQIATADVVAELRGKDLACWCKPGSPCHADVLLEVANA